MGKNQYCRAQNSPNSPDRWSSSPDRTADRKSLGDLTVHIFLSPNQSHRFSSTVHQGKKCPPEWSGGGASLLDFSLENTLWARRKQKFETPKPAILLRVQMCNANVRGCLTSPWCQGVRVSADAEDLQDEQKSQLLLDSTCGIHQELEVTRRLQFGPTGLTFPFVPHLADDWGPARLQRFPFLETGEKGSRGLPRVCLTMVCWFAGLLGSPNHGLLVCQVCLTMAFSFTRFS